jgi:glycosyltransferase involved in cell wall biosynthesis
MKEQPLVSVLMTSYNREKFIGAAIESVLASSYSNFELIVCDDCSIDNTVAIVESYAEKDKRIKVYINDHNLGDYPNRNKAASYAQGKYIKYQDSDDLIYPYSLQMMVESIEQFPEALFAFSANEVQDNAQPYPIFFTSEEAFRRHFFGAGGLFYAGPGGAIIRKKSFDEFGPFSGKRFISDAEMWMKLAMVGPILKIHPGLIWWRVHEGQEFTMGLNEYVLLRYNLDKEILGHVNCPLTDEEKKAALGNSRRLIGRKILRLFFRELNFSSAIELSKKTGIGPISLFESLLPVNKMRKAYKNLTNRN